MIRLLASELRRFWSRRIVKVAVVAGAVGILVTTALFAANSRAPSAEQLAQQERDYRTALEDCREGHWMQEDELPPGQTLEEWCEQNVTPEMFAYDERFRLGKLPEILMGSAFIWILAGWFLGASFVGAEWHAGTIATLLTWEPRRARVLAAKAIAAIACFVVIAVVLQTALSLGLWMVAETRGVPDVGPTFTRTVARTIFSVAAVSGVGTAIGLALAMLGRNTSAALGIGFAYLAVIERLLAVWRPAWQRWLLGENVLVFVTGRAMHFSAGNFADGGGAIVSYTRTPAQAALLVTAYAAALLVLAGIAFRRRDVT